MLRFFELLPGLLTWLTLGLMFFLSWLIPMWVAIFIIFFDTYWLLKTIYLSFHLRATFRKIRKNMKINWRERLERFGTSWQGVQHLIIFPLYKESYEIVRESFRSLVQANYPLDKFIVVLSVEARAGEEGQETAQKIEEEFGSCFFKFFVTTHPADIAGELPGKGSNETWAAREARAQIIDPLKLSYENILVSVFDVDTQVLPEYFGVLTYTFLTAEYPQRSSYQPVPLFTNNIFQAPALARVIAFTSTFWHMMQQSRPEQLTTFSSHSMPFKALVEIGFWNTDIVSEDSQIFWQCFLHYNGDWRAVPLFYPVSMDASVAQTFWGTMRNLYKQQRRWAWGVENIPYAFFGFLKNIKIPRKAKWYWSFKKLDAFHSWSTHALLIFALGWLPILLGGTEFNFSLLSYNLPRVTRMIMTLAMVGIASSAVISVLMLPPRPAWFRPWHYLLYIIQWVLMPLTLIVFGALPAIEAQTRLMFGGRWRLGFWHTPKYR